MSGEKSKPSSSETGMCPHNNFPSTCEQCSAEQKNRPEETKVESIECSELQRGDKLTVEIDYGEHTRMYEILVTGIRKNGLLVDVTDDKGDHFTARMPGVMTLDVGPTPGKISVVREGEEHCLYFENVKDPETGERRSKAMRTMIIKNITHSKINK